MSLLQSSPHLTPAVLEPEDELPAPNRPEARAADGRARHSTDGGGGADGRLKTATLYVPNMRDAAIARADRGRPERGDAPLRWPTASRAQLDGRYIGLVRLARAQHAAVERARDEPTECK